MANSIYDARFVMADVQATQEKIQLITVIQSPIDIRKKFFKHTGKYAIK